MSVEDNIFVNRVDQLLERVCDDNQNDELMDLSPSIGRASKNRMFTRRRTEAREAFVSRNGPDIPISVWSSHGTNPATSGVLMDTRTLTGHFNLLASVVQANHMELQWLKHSMKISDRGSPLRARSPAPTQWRGSSTWRGVSDGSKKIFYRRLPSRNHPLQKESFFSVSSKCLPTSASLSEVTAAFFVDDCRTGCTLETKSPAWNERDFPTKKKLWGQYSLIRRTVRLVLMHADSFPPPLSSNTNRAQHKREVFAMAREAEERLRVVLRFDAKAVSTRSKLEKVLGLKETEATLRLPANTPDDWCKFIDN